MAARVTSRPGYSYWFRMPLGCVHHWGWFHALTLAVTVARCQHCGVWMHKSGKHERRIPIHDLVHKLRK